MTDDPLFTQKLIGFRGWRAVWPPIGYGSEDPLVIRLASDVQLLERRLREQTEEMDELRSELDAKTKLVETLSMQRHPITNLDVFPPPLPPPSYHFATVMPPVASAGIAYSFRRVAEAHYGGRGDPGLWTGSHVYWHPRQPAAAVCMAGAYQGHALGNRDLAHVAPDRMCTCGLHATYDLTSAYGHGDFDWVVGAVAAWGRIEAHREVFRAQFMEPVLLGYEPMAPPEQQRQVKEMAKMYGIEAVPIGELAGRAREFGQPIPSIYRGDREARDARTMGCRCRTSGTGVLAMRDASDCPVHR